ncbi:DUF5667 domain-containing protein [Clostridium lundense]|uniref:DUF5667 domain-containing protein n=1 Tax=Clostridium lundense TaxID=319475 RepID=UPI0004885075|nr:DUF5667 domain-containing protein [Clostridium lundense]
MKKITTLVAAAAIIFNLGGSVLAADPTSLQDKAGITPDSILYPVDQAIDNLKISLAQNTDSKVQTLADIAEERLGEGEVLASEEKGDLAQTAIEDFNNKMEQASQEVQNVISKTDEENSEEDLDKANNLNKELELKQKNSIEVLKKVQEKVSGNAKEVIGKVIEMQTKKKEAVANMIKERHELNAAKKEFKDAAVQLKKVQKSGSEEDIKNAESLLKDKETTLQKAQEEYKSAVENKKNVVKDSKKSKNNIKKEVPVKDNDEKVTNVPKDTTTSNPVDTNVVNTNTEENNTTVNEDNTNKNNNCKKTNSLENIREKQKNEQSHTKEIKDEKANNKK